MRADLHTHTTCSDGTVSPEDLIDAAQKSGLGALSITDHDTLKAYDLIQKREGFQIIPGIEISANFGKSSVHLLAYSFSLKNEELRALCQQQIVRREKRNQEILERLKKLGCHIEPEELYFTPTDQISSIGRPHIAKIMMNKGFVHSIREAFDRYIGEEGPSFVGGARCSVEEAIEVVHAAGGFVVIAHPHYIKDKSALRKLLKMPLDGLEAYYAHFTQEHVPYWLGVAKEHGLFVTGGSDFHGDVKPHHYLGASCTPLDAFDRLLQRSLENNGSL